MLKLFAGLSSLLSILLLGAATATPAAADEYAVGYRNVPNSGVFGWLETASPIVRDGQWSYMRISLYAFTQPVTAYVRIGALKQQHMSWPSVYWLSVDANGNFRQDYGATIYCCTGYNYQISRSASPSQWNIYFNGADRPPIASVFTGFQVAEQWESGGQVTSASNGMGNSGNWWVAYRDPGEIWRPGSNYLTYITNPQYWVAGLNAQSWQVGGNN